MSYADNYKEFLIAKGTPDFVAKYFILGAPETVEIRKPSTRSGHWTFKTTTGTYFHFDFNMLEKTALILLLQLAGFVVKHSN